MSSLTEFLTGIANAIRSKKGTTEPINAQNFASEIENISASGTSDMLQARVDATNNADYLFYHYTGDNVDFIKNLDLSNVTSTQYMFNGCSNLITLPQLDTSNITNMGDMFAECSNLTTLSRLNTNNATVMSYMFSSCFKIDTIDITNFTPNSASATFFYCYSLKKLIIRGNINTHVSYNSTFDGCYHLTGTVDPTYNPNGDKDGYIYVPRNMVDTLKSSTNWSKFGDQIRALEDYTVDGTTTGDLDESKI